jgi:aerobic-type carbon monoxide dehydrogenase small subunit (CoxS/CutS family)
MKPAPFDYVRADSVEHAVTRCTGYTGIVDAVRQGAAAMKG